MKSELFEEARDIGRAEARVDQGREFILRLGLQRFGRAPTRPQRADLDALADRDRVRRLIDRLLIATSWGDLLATE